LLLKKNISFPIQDDVFCFIYYFYAFILHDVWNLKKHIPNQITNVLNIGAGIGLFELYLNHVNKQILKFFIIEKNNLNHNGQFIDVLSMAKQTISANKLGNKFFYYSDENYLNINTTFDLVLSFRSWGYKYEIDTYLDFILNSLTSDATLIIDIRKKYNEKKLLDCFKDVSVIVNYVEHRRYLLKKFIG